MCQTDERKNANAKPMLLRRVRLMDPASGRDEITDILLADGLVRAIGSGAEAPEGTDVYTAADGVVASPGLVDTHSHFRDPGFPEKETMETGVRAALRGGYTSILMMANTRPPIDSVPVLTSVLEKAARMPIHVYSAANVTVGMAGDTRTDLVGLAEAGARVFTDDGVPITDRFLLETAMKLARKISIPISLHEEDPKFVTNPGVNAGSEAARRLNLTGADREAEIRLVKRDLELAVATGCALCIQHISAKESVDLVREAKKRSPKIEAEATPHHFSLTEEAVLTRGTLAKVNPPIRTEADRQAIIEGLADGTIGIIATDHAPHAPWEKEKPFPEAPSGMIGLETALSLGLKHLVAPGHLSLMALLEKLTAAPAAYYRLPAGRLCEGGPADLVLFAPDASWTVTEDFASKAKNSPFIGETLPGVVLATVCSGEMLYRGDAFDRFLQ